MRTSEVVPFCYNLMQEVVGFCDNLEFVRICRNLRFSGIWRTLRF